MPICTFVFMYVSKDVYIPLLRAKKYVGVFVLVLFTFIIIGREGEQRGGKRKEEEREERKGSAGSQDHLSSSPFSEAAARIDL